jgi:hypothetical protein
MEAQVSDTLTLRDVAEKYWTPPAELVGKLPRVTCGDCSDKRKTCDRHKKKKCVECGAWVSEAHIHLDYVGHPDVDRTLTEIDPEWNWEPVAWDEDGLPLIKWRDKAAVLWGRLTLLGKPKLCVGSCDPNKVDVDKELVGDLIRNGAMRHHVFASLWSKADRQGIPEREEPVRRSSGRSGSAQAKVNDDGEPMATDEQRQQFTALCDVRDMDRDERREWVKGAVKKTAWNQVTRDEADLMIHALRGEQWVLTKGQDGKWFAFERDTEPWSSGDEDPVPVQETLDA